MRAITTGWVLTLGMVVLAVGSAAGQPAPMPPDAKTVPAPDVSGPVGPPTFALPNGSGGLWGNIAPRFSVGYTNGPGFGYQNGFTNLDSFWPIFGASPNEVLFVDVRGLLSDDRLLWGNNVELGYRRYNADLDRIFGAWAAWDLRNTPITTYEQAAFGLHTYGRYLDAHANGYVVPASQGRITGTTIYTNNPLFQNFNILLPTNVNYQSPLSGTDLEVGGPLPMLGQYGFRLYGGAYAYHADTYGSVGGVQTRLLARLSNNLDFGLQVRSDNAFGTTVAASGAIRWGGLRRQYRQPERDSVYNRIVDPIDRNQNIAVLDKSKGFNQVARDINTGAPLRIVFVNTSLAVSGNGSLQNPFNSLSQAVAAAGTNGIVAIIPSGTNATNSGITLLTGQHLLGTGVQNFLLTQQGVVTLPAFGTGTPVITNTAGAGITLASNDELANVAISSPTAQGITGTGINGFSIHNVSITGSGAPGILITNATGFGQIANNTISGATGNGVTISQSTGALSLVVLSNTVSSNTSNGIFVSQTGGNINGTIANNSTSSNTAFGIALSVSGGTGGYAIQGNSMVNDNQGGGTGGFSAATTAGTLGVTLNNNNSAPANLASAAGYFFNQTGGTLGANLYSNGGSGNQFNGAAISPPPATTSPAAVVNSGGTATIR